MTQQAVLYKSIDTLPQKYFGEVIDFVGYLQNKAKQEAEEAEALAKAKAERSARDIEIINKYADELNAEAADVRKYSVPLFEGEDEE